MLCSASQYRTWLNHSTWGRVEMDLPGMMFLGLAETLISNSALLPASYRIRCDYGCASR
jgi:hypothetical protein